MKPSDLQLIVGAITDETGLSVDSVRTVLTALENLSFPTDVLPELQCVKRVLPELTLRIDDNDALAAGAEPSRTRVSKSKIGGHPDWVQDPTHPGCCGTYMTFYGQFDSNLGGPYTISDSGIIYNFYCESCWATHAELQYY